MNLHSDYPGTDTRAPPMAVAYRQLNRLERTLFSVALGLAGLLTVVRLVSIAVIVLVYRIR
jgi:hypothetical protein